MSHHIALFDPANFNIFLAVMAATAVIVFIALHFVTAGYGMMRGRHCVHLFPTASDGW